MENDFEVKTTLDLIPLKKWLENQIGIRKDKKDADKGFEEFVISFTEFKKFKSLKQNRTFWALINCFWESGCGSFYTYDDMKEYYYRIAGLISIKTKSILCNKTKNMLYKAIKILPLTFGVKQKIYKMLRGEYEKHESWSIVKKKKARLAIDTLMHDMDESNVLGSKMGKKYEEILKGMDKI